jgi:hypothetical protein
MSNNEMLYDDYVQPPSYKDFNNEDKVTNSLITKLEKHINNDLTQINSVYDIRIKNAELIKQKEYDEIERNFLLTKITINNERNLEISQYNIEAEKRIGGLISNLNKSDQKIIKRIWDWFNIINI